MWPYSKHLIFMYLTFLIHVPLHILNIFSSLCSMALKYSVMWPSNTPGFLPPTVLHTGTQIIFLKCMLFYVCPTSRNVSSFSLPKVSSIPLKPSCIYCYFLIVFLYFSCSHSQLLTVSQSSFQHSTIFHRSVHLF